MYLGRSFVSTGLLSRTWDRLTVIELRTEARARGLSTQGNKAALVARIKEHERTTATTPPLPKRPVQAAAPGIPLPARPDRAPTRPDFLAIKLPDPPRPPPTAPIQVPYLPDVRRSTQPKASGLPLELDRPKLHVVSGSATHYDGGPTHNLEKLQEGESPHPPPQPQRVQFWPRFWEGKDEFRSHSRPLTSEERKGLYVLLGIIGGSWFVGAFLNRPKVVADESDTSNH